MATTKKTEKIVKAAEPVVTAKAEEKKIETAAPAAEAPKTEAKAAEAPKAEKKPAEKKPAEKKPAAKKAAAPAKKTEKPAAAKKAEKPAAEKKAEKPAAEKKAAEKSEEVVLQFGAKEINIDEIVANCKAAYKNGSKKQIKTIKVYVKPEDSKAYYVVNGKDASSIDL